MGRIKQAFDRAREEHRAALVIYLCAGDPDLSTTVELVLAAAEAGADVIELGMPFSDPTADGIAIQRASERALARGTKLSGVLDCVRRVREKSEVPILLFGYYNPILAHGEARVVEMAADAGVDGFLVVDLPPEESAPLREPALARGLDYVPLVAPTSDAARVKLAADHASAFIYYVSMTGVTGAAVTDLEAASVRGGEVQRLHGKPVAMGFGIRTRQDVAVAARSVDGVVVGSAVVRTVEDAPSPEAAVAAVRGLVADLRAGVSRP